MVIGLAAVLRSRLPRPDGPLVARASIRHPAIILFIVLLFLPQARPRDRPAASPSRDRRHAEVWDGLSAGRAARRRALPLAAVVVDRPNLDRLTLGASSPRLIMLSLVPLTGWAGQVSLRPASPSPASAPVDVLAARGGDGSPLGILLVAPRRAPPLGALVALPALRLQGLYLALATMAFADRRQALFFATPRCFGRRRARRRSSRWTLFGFRSTDQATTFILFLPWSSRCGVGLIALRRGRSARRWSP